jgi:LacI family transcriptional regulator
MRGRPAVALLIETSNHFARELLHGIRGYTREHEPWAIRLGEHKRGDAPPAWLKRWKGDGVIARLENARIARGIGATSVPIVNVSAARPVPGFPGVKTDDEAIARLAAEHFRARGFRSFAFSGVRGYRWSELRRDHFVRILAERGFACSVYEEPRVPRKGDPFHQDGRALARWLRRLAKPVGICACWDGCGAQILAQCRSLGIHVPEEVAVLGVDNDDLLCDLADAPLSSIDPNAYRIGYEAAEILDRMMGGRRVAPETRLVEPLGVHTRLSSDILAVDDPEIAAALRFIREHALRGIKVEGVLRKVPLSRRVLESRFKKLVGRTPHEHILALRLEKARSLLAETDLTLGAIAERSGFQHAEYMSVAFKRSFGFSPSDYRARGRGRRSSVLQAATRPTGGHRVRSRLL